MYKKNKILCSIAARAGSKGVPGKNLKLLNNKPLIFYSINAAIKSKYIDKVIMSTEDEEIADTALKFGAEVPYIRDKSLTDDLTPLTEVTKDTMKRMDLLGFHSDIVIQLSPTCPFITEEIIDKCIEESDEVDSVVTLKRIEHEHPYRAKEIDEEGYFKSFIKDIDVESFQSRQELPDLYCTSGAIYLRRRDNLERWNGKSFALGKKSKGVILSDLESINIDRPIDFSYAEFLSKEL